MARGQSRSRVARRFALDLEPRGVRSRRRARAGLPEREVRAGDRDQVAGGFPAGLDRLFFGGRCDNQSNWEGRLDEIAVFDRALSAEEIVDLAVR